MSTATMKLRSDLVISRQDAPEGTAYVIKDPVTERFFRFRDIEHFIAQQFDGATSPDAVRQRVAERLGVALSPDNLEQFVSRLQRIGLLTPADAGAAAPPPLLDRHPITVLLADDHIVVRQGLRALLQAEEDIRVAGEAGNGREAVRLTRNLLPDVVVMDIAMPVLNGLEATRRIVREVPGTRVLILSSYNNDEYVRQLTEAGAVGYLLKEIEASDLTRAIREVHRGNAFCSPAISKRLLEHYHQAFLEGRPRKKIPEGLTSRETEVLQLIAEGGANQQIATELCLSPKTVEKHRLRLMNKLNIHEIAGLTHYALARGIVRAL